MTSFQTKGIVQNAKDLKLIDVRTFELYVSHQMVLEFIAGTEDTNYSAHGEKAKVVVPGLDKPTAIIPGFYLDNVVANFSEQYLQEKIMGVIMPTLKSAEMLYVGMAPVDSTLVGKLFFYENKEGEINVIPEMNVRRNRKEDILVCSSNILGNDISNIAKTSQLVYDFTPRMIDIPNAEETVDGYIKRIDSERVTQFYKAFGLELNPEVPTNFLIALSSWAIIEKIKKDGLIDENIKTPVYTSRELKNYAFDNTIKIDDEILLVPSIKVRRDSCSAEVTGYYQGTPLFNTKANLRLITQ